MPKKSKNMIEKPTPAKTLEEPVKREKVKEIVKTSTDNSTNQNYGRRKIVNNWAKYEEDVTTEDDTLTDDRDLSYLLKNSTSDTSYFQLASEKEWDRYELPSERSLFSLDLKLISSSLACLPFYEVIGLDPKLLSSENIRECDSQAKMNVLKNKPFLDRHKETVKTEEPKQSLEPSSPALDPEKPEDCTSLPEDAENLEEMEDWLDSILSN